MTKLVKTMSTKELSKITGRYHTNVKRAVKKLFLKMGHKESDFAKTLVGLRGGVCLHYNLPKQETIFLVSGFRYDQQECLKKIKARWAEIEAEDMK